jgi:hypothetical protein
MKTLTGDRLALIDALVAETELGGVMAALLQKKNTLTDALRALLHCGTIFAPALCEPRWRVDPP